MWRSFTCIDEGPNGPGELLVVTGGDGRVEIGWAPEVSRAAADAGFALDANHYVAPLSSMGRN